MSIDIGINYQGYHTDKAVTFPVGGISSERKHLIATTKEALGKAIKIIKPGIDTSQIGEIIQKTIENKNYHVVRDLAGHGIGKKIHEPPTIYNFKTKDGLMGVWGSTVLDTRLKNLEEGEEVKIVYLGVVPSNTKAST